MISRPSPHRNPCKLDEKRNGVLNSCGTIAEDNGESDRKSQWQRPGRHRDGSVSVAAIFLYDSPLTIEVKLLKFFLLIWEDTAAWGRGGYCRSARRNSKRICEQAKSLEWRRIDEEMIDGGGTTQKLNH